MAVVPQKHEVNVTFFRNGKLETVAAKGAIMATPKFITARIVENMPEKQRAAITRIHYIPYPVVNLIYDKPVFNRVRRLVPGEHSHGHHRRRLGNPRPAWIQAEIQHSDLLHQVYGMPIKAVIHEKFGDGIMCLIDFTVHVDKEQDPKGESGETHDVGQVSALQGVVAILQWVRDRLGGHFTPRRDAC